jgi:hypothetical protein
VPVIELDSTEDRKPQRPRTRIYLAVAAAVLVAAAAATALTVSRSGGNQLRFEVETASGTALQIQWNIGIMAPETIKGASRGEAFPTPWSTTVAVEEVEGTVALMVMSAATDEVTCRIIANGETVAEGSQDRVIGCVFDLKDLAT